MLTVLLGCCVMSGKKENHIKFMPVKSAFGLNTHMCLKSVAVDSIQWLKHLYRTETFNAITKQNLSSHYFMTVCMLFRFFFVYLFTYFSFYLRIFFFTFPLASFVHFIGTVAVVGAATATIAIVIVPVIVIIIENKMYVWFE